MASITIYLQCCCLPTTNTNTTTEQNKHTHTHTRPKTKPNVARSESTRKQRPTVSANPHLREEGRRMKRKRKWSNITHATHLKFRASEVQFTVTAQQIQNVLNENLSQSGSGLAKIGTEWGSGEGHFSKTSLTASSSHRSPSPFQRLIHPKDLGGVICLVWVYIMTWQCNVSAIMASDSPEDFPIT